LEFTPGTPQPGSHHFSAVTSISESSPVLSSGGVLKIHSSTFFFLSFFYIHVTHFFLRSHKCYCLFKIILSKPPTTWPQLYLAYLIILRLLNK